MLVVRLGGDRALFEAYMAEARPSEAALPDFPRLALAWALVGACRCRHRSTGSTRWPHWTSSPIGALDWRDIVWVSAFTK